MSDQASPADPLSASPGRNHIDRVGRRLDQVFAAEEREGQHLAIKGRSVALLAIAILLPFVAPFPDVLYYHGLLAVFLLLGFADARLSLRGPRRPWYGYAFMAMDFALLSFTLLYPNPLATFEFPPQLVLRSGIFIYFFVLLCGLAFTYRPRTMLLGGVVGALAWAVGVLWIVTLPDTKVLVSVNLPPDVFLRAVMEPTFVDMGTRLQEIVVFLIVAGLLAVIVARSRRLVLRQAASERARGNLARHFPPNMVDRLSQMDSPLTQVREQEVAVLFADVVGFTRWSENRSPAEVIAFLRQVHARLERAVFEHGGTLDKFIGDGVMATFGTPETGPHDAANGLRALRSILDSFDEWNASRSRRGEGAVRISVGLHYGTVVIGDIGSERRLEFAVLGDTVNLASRLERLTRGVGCRAAVSDATVRAVREAETGDVAASLLDGLTPGAAEEIRGRQESVRIWTL